MRQKQLATPLGGIAEDLAAIISQGPAAAKNIAAILGKIQPHLNTVRRVVDDPAFGTVMQRIKTISDIEAAKPVPVVQAGQTPPPAPGAGVGLSKAVPILDGYIYTLRNPWVPWVVGGGIIAILVGIGYRMGQKKAKAA